MSDQNAMLKMLYEDHKRLSRTETREVPGAIPGFTSFYDTGSFTPAYAGSVTPGTYTYNAGVTKVEWTRIGNRLFFSGRIEITAITVAPTGSMLITGFPFAGVADTTMIIAGGGTMIAWLYNVAAGYTDVNFEVLHSQSFLTLIKNGDNIAQATILAGELLVGGVWFEGQYRVA